MHLIKKRSQIHKQNLTKVKRKIGKSTIMIQEVNALSENDKTNGQKKISKTIEYLNDTSI